LSRDVWSVLINSTKVGVRKMQEELSQKSKKTLTAKAQALFGFPEGGKTQRTQKAEIETFILCVLCVFFAFFAVKKTFKTALISIYGY
jgi:hypothetical protein